MLKESEIKENIRKGYAKVAEHANRREFIKTNFACCNPSELINKVSMAVGYTEKELTVAPDDANLGLGCGNPTAFSSIKAGETILDLGSGAGFDSFIASSQTGPDGKVIGVDITPEMIEKARRNAKTGNYQNVEFIQGDIEKLPVPSNSIDLAISNCVINLAVNKQEVFNEIFRVLKPGGRMMISDIILLKDLPEIISGSFEGYIACLAGAINKEAYLGAIKNAGFEGISINKETRFPVELLLTDPVAANLININNLQEDEVREISDSIASIGISACKRKN